MRVAFAGTPEFARRALRALIDAGYTIPLVLTQPDRPAGRGLKQLPSAVKQEAVNHNIAVAQPRSLRLDGRWPDDAQAAHAALMAAQADVMVVAAYGLILPSWVLQLPEHGCLNIHASLLPRWRGAAPIQRAIEAGDAETGVTIMQMDEGLDTGAMICAERVSIGEQTAGELHDVLADLGADLITQTLARLAVEPLQATPQPSDGVTYAEKISKAEARLSWQDSATHLARRIRAFNPVPGASLPLPGLTEPVKVWRATALNQAAQGEPGSIMAVHHDGIDINCAEGVLRLEELQKAGGKRQPADTFRRGWSPE